MAHVVVLQGSQVLLVERAKTGFADGWCSLPGGHIDARETPAEAALRELQEEVGVRVEAEHLQPRCVLPYRTSRSVGCNFVFTAVEWSGTAQNLEPHKASRVLWVDPTLLPERTVPFVSMALEVSGTDDWYREVISAPATDRSHRPGE